MDFTGATACIWGAGTVITMLVLMWMEAYDRELGHERWYTPMTPLERVCTCILWPLAAVVIPGIVVVARISLWLRPAHVEKMLDGEREYGRGIWGLLNLELWAQAFLDR